MLWNDSFHEVRSALHGTAKSIAPQKPFSFHMVRNITFRPFYSAVDDYSKVADYSDFLKIACYNNAGDQGCRTSSAITGTDGNVQIYPGIDIDVPTGKGEKHTTPEDVIAATRAVFSPVLKA